MIWADKELREVTSIHRGNNYRHQLNVVAGIISLSRWRRRMKVEVEVEVGGGGVDSLTDVFLDSTLSWVPPSAFQRTGRRAGHGHHGRRPPGTKKVSLSEPEVGLD